ncbi:hypothetical protein AMTRI_Chr04g184270 [Amborella trichopoda]
MRISSRFQGIAHIGIQKRTNHIHVSIYIGSSNLLIEVSFRKAMKKAIELDVELAEQANTKRIQAQIERASERKRDCPCQIDQRRHPLHTIQAKIDNCSYMVQTIYGVLGIKI